MNNNIVVSVCIVTYNHGLYIEKALDSVVNQKVNFEYEVLIIDDASTDGTQNILKNYRKKYSDKIKLFLRNKNKGRPTYNFYYILNRCKGKYIAFLEGDDYWIDMNKLKKQVEFLDNHKQYIGVTHSNLIVNEKNEIIRNFNFENMYNWKGKFTMYDLVFIKDDFYKYPGHTASCMCRNIFINSNGKFSIIYKAHDFIGDLTLFVVLLMQSDIYRMNDVMSVWRCVERKGKSNWTSEKLNRNIYYELFCFKVKLLVWCKKNCKRIDKSYINKLLKQLITWYIGK